MTPPVAPTVRAEPLPAAKAGARDPLLVLVGAAALVAPALHIASDALEWLQQGFSPAQLWLTYAAFLPMPWLLLGLWAVARPRPGLAGLAGALLYGVAFTYFAHTALYALAERLPSYDALWQRIGTVYTLHGALMVLGGVLFGVAALRAGAWPRAPVWIFLAGIALNALLALVPVPDVLQTLGSVVRNAGLIGLGWATLAGRRPRAS
jgi:hypothetical protein